jgi:transcriptional regulator with XRE-family HTH domain
VETKNPGNSYERVQRLARLVRRLRLERNLSKNKLAQRGGIGTSTLNQLERVLDGGPLVGMPSPDTLRGIARGLATNGTGARNCDEMRAIYSDLMQEIGYCDAPPANVVTLPRVVLDRLTRLGGAEIELGLTGRAWTETDITNVLRAIDEATRRQQNQSRGGNSNLA